MGWLFQNRPKGIKTEEFFKEAFPDLEFLKSVSRRDAFYSAVTDKKGALDGRVWALVIAVEWARNDFYNFGWKDMDETMHPCYYDCPDSILDLLSPTDSEWALEWRAECRRLNNIRVPEVGDQVEFEDPVTWTQYGVRKISQRFTYQGARVFASASGRVRLRVGWHKHRNFTITGNSLKENGVIS